MKCFIFPTVFLMSILICGNSFAAEPIQGQMYTAVGKIDKTTDTNPAYAVLESPKSPSKLARTVAEFGILETNKNATPEFRKCIDNANYKGIVEITAKVKHIEADEGSEHVIPILTIDKSSTCKRR